jgi:uncharacterized protein
MDILKIFTLFNFFFFLNSCSFVNGYIGQISNSGEKDTTVVVAKSSEIKLTATSNPLGFIPSQIIARPGQVLKLKVINKLKDMPLVFSILKKDEDPIVNAFLGVQEGEAKQWFPPNEHRLIKTNLLVSNQSESIVLTLPNEPGDYSFISSYPGQADELKGLIKVEDPTENKED